MILLQFFDIPTLFRLMKYLFESANQVLSNPWTDATRQTADGKLGTDGQTDLKVEISVQILVSGQSNNLIFLVKASSCLLCHCVLLTRIDNFQAREVVDQMNHFSQSIIDTPDYISSITWVRISSPCDVSFVLTACPRRHHTSATNGNYFFIKEIF